jgi:Acetyltransferase (GNAT) family
MLPGEISLAVDWAAAEGWNPGLADDACFASVDPEGFFIGELDGAPVAIVSCVNYDASFSFLGFYIVRADLRGKGYGLRRHMHNHRFPRIGQRTRLLTSMDRFWLHIICASLLLLVTAFALGTPGLKSEGLPEQAILLRVAAR